MNDNLFLYLVALVLINYVLPYRFFKDKKDKEFVLIIGGVLWIIEYLLFVLALNNGYSNDNLLVIYYIGTMIPIAYLLMLVGIIIFITKYIKKKRSINKQTQ